MGTLNGMTVIEMAGLGPAPFCGMMLGDLGARVIRIERNAQGSSKVNVLLRNRESIVVNAKHEQGRDLILEMVRQADALIEGFRPGVMERLGLGPDVCLAANSRLVYGRVTGWGQEGPLAQSAGHDINYVSLAGVVDAIGPREGPPVPPLNLAGDYGGGGMFLAYGVLAALWQVNRTGRGQVIDCAMVDGASALMAEWYGFYANGEFGGPRASHWLDGGAPYYRCYRTADDRFVSIGPLEDPFYADLLERLGVSDDPEFADRSPSRWPALAKKLEAIFRTRTRDEWTQVLEGTDACYAPVLSFSEVAAHEHIRARRTLIEVAGVRQAAPAPRFAATPSTVPRPARAAGQDTRDILRSFGFDDSRIEVLEHAQVIHQG